MSRPKPKCAWCGDPLGRGAQTLHQWRGLPGSPQVGWHWAESGSCDLNDPDLVAYQSGARDTASLIAAIEARGEGRVVRSGRSMARSA